MANFALVILLCSSHTKMLLLKSDTMLYVVFCVTVIDVSNLLCIQYEIIPEPCLMMLPRMRQVLKKWGIHF